MELLEADLAALGREAQAAFVARARLSDAHPYHRERYRFAQPDGSVLCVDIEADGATLDIEVSGQAAYGRRQLVALIILDDDATTIVRCPPESAAILGTVRAGVLAAARGETRLAVAA